LKDEEEALLIERICQGERNAYENLVVQYEGMVYSMLLRQTGDVLIARELTQETFIKAYFALKTFRRNSRFSSWLIRIALNTSATYFSSARYKMALRSVPIDARMNLTTTDGETRELEQDLKELRKCIARLNDKYRAVLTLCSFEGKSYREASQILEIPEGTVASRMNKAFKIIKNDFLRQRSAK